MESMLFESVLISMLFRGSFLESMLFYFGSHYMARHPQFTTPMGRFLTVYVSGEYVN